MNITMNESIISLFDETEHPVPWSTMFEAFARTKNDQGLFEFCIDMRVNGESLYAWLISQSFYDVPARTLRFQEIGINLDDVLEHVLVTEASSEEVATEVPVAPENDRIATEPAPQADDHATKQLAGTELKTAASALVTQPAKFETPNQDTLSLKLLPPIARAKRAGHGKAVRQTNFETGATRDFISYIDAARQFETDSARVRSYYTNIRKIAMDGNDNSKCRLGFGWNLIGSPPQTKMRPANASPAASKQAVTTQQEVVQDDNHWNKMYEQLRLVSSHSGEYIGDKKTELYRWFLQQELLFRLRETGAPDALSDDHLERFQSLGYFAETKPACKSPVPSLEDKFVPSERGLNTLSSISEGTLANDDPPAPTVPDRDTYDSFAPSSHDELERRNKRSAVADTIQSSNTLLVQGTTIDRSLKEKGDNSLCGRICAREEERCMMDGTRSTGELKLKSESNEQCDLPGAIGLIVQAPPKLPQLDLSKWFLPVERYRFVCGLNNSYKGCGRGNRCTYIHTQNPWGFGLEKIWPNCNKRLPPEVEARYDEFCNGMALEAGSKMWYTARYNSATRQTDEGDRKLVFAEGGLAAFQSEQGVFWYHTMEEAKAALKRVVIVTYWVTSRRLPFNSRVKGLASDVIAKRVKEEILYELNMHRKRSQTCNSTSEPSLSCYGPRSTSMNYHSTVDGPRDTGALRYHGYAQPPMSDHHTSDQRHGSKHAHRYEQNSRSHGGSVDGGIPPSHQHGWYSDYGTYYPPTKRHHSQPRPLPISQYDLPLADTQWIKNRADRNVEDCSEFKMENVCSFGLECPHFHFLSSSVTVRASREIRENYFASSRRAIEERFEYYKLKGRSGQSYYTAGYRCGRFVALAEGGRGMMQSDKQLWWYTSKDEARDAVYDRIRVFI
ncbi:hypothetical protein MPSEU_000300300 [Mayamaea pseudoterrestris]|nr:hypothetical protein MPSEU_000300300 [Mayamaea pseudoterrestris]